MEKFKQIVFQLYNSPVVRYVFFGGLTTAVNLVSYFLLRRFASVPIVMANIISISLAILFAFCTNSKYVFKSAAKTHWQHLGELAKFWGVRLVTMAIEVGGVWFIARCGLNEMLGKFAVQFVVLALNYIFSKFIVFCSSSEE